jgi:hypothetical protein
MQIILDVKGELISLTADDFIKSLNEEDKRKLAVEVMKDHFKIMMEKKYDYHGYDTGASRLIGELQKTLIQNTAVLINENEEYKKNIQYVVTTLMPTMPMLISQAIVQLIANGLRDSLSGITQNQFDIQNLGRELQKLLGPR